MPATEVKLFEVRDQGTHIPVMAVRVTPDASHAYYPLRRAGYTVEKPYVFVTKLGHLETQYDPHDWGNRTMRVAHDTIGAKWDAMPSGSVVDVEYELGERTVPKRSERLLNCPDADAIGPGPGAPSYTTEDHPLEAGFVSAAVGVIDDGDDL